MSLTTAEIGTVTGHLAPLLRGGEIVRIDQPDKWRVIFHIRNRAERYWLQVVARAGFSRLHLLTARPRISASPLGFCNLLRQHLTGSPIEGLTRAAGDRVVVMHCAERDALMRKKPVRLVAELVGAGSNIILLNSEGMVLGSLFPEDSRRRCLSPGSSYEPLSPAPENVERAGEDRFHACACSGDVLSLSRAIIKHYERAEQGDLFESRLRELTKRLRARRSKLERLRGNIMADIKESEKAEQVRHDGELLKIALPDMIKGRRSVTVLDLFREGTPERKIELDRFLTPQENVQRLFQRYKRLKKRLVPLREKLTNIENESDELEKIRVSLDNITTLRELREFEQSLQIRRMLPGAEPVPAGRQAAGRGHGPRRFCSEHGFEILVARNRRENHRLTFSIARGNDCWMHVLGRPGPHVIIRRAKDREIPAGTLLDAAHLAVYYSKARGGDFVRVVHTLCKYVKPAREAGPGAVHYSGESTIGVRPGGRRLRAVLDRSREPD